MSFFRSLLLNGLVLLFGLALALGAGELLVRALYPVHSTRVDASRFDAECRSFAPNATWTYVEPEFVEEVSINSLGFRDQEIDPARPTLVFLGDSQTYGTGVNFGERFSDRVRQALEAQCPNPGLNVLNAAIPGADTLDQLEMLECLERRGVRPAHIFVCVTANDHYANAMKLQAEQAKAANAVDPGDAQGVAGQSEEHPEVRANVQPDVRPTAGANVGPDVRPETGPGLGARLKAGLVSFLREVRYRSRLLVFVMGRLQEFEWFRDWYVKAKYRSGAGEIAEITAVYEDSPELRLWTKATGEILARVAKHGPTSVLLIPDRYRYDPRLRREAAAYLERTGHKPDFEAESRDLREVANGLGLPFLDPAPALAKYENPSALSYAINGHHRPLGHELIARELLRESETLRRAARCGGE